MRLNRISRNLPLIILLLVFSMFIVVGCDDNGDEVGNPVGGDDPLTWNDDMETFFLSSCTPCHTNTPPQSGFFAGDFTQITSGTTTAGNRFVLPGQADSSEIIWRLEQDGWPMMPASGALSSSDIAMVREWIDDGALEE